MAIACVNLTPWGLALLEQAHSGLPLGVLDERRRITHVNKLAREAGVQPGMRDVAALSRCPELHAEPVSALTQQAAWKELLEGLYARYSDRVDGPVPGLAFLVLSPAPARELAAALRAPVGVAASRELAQLAARRAAPGDVRVVGAAAQAFLALTPLEHLDFLGMTPRHLEGLRFLGLRTLGELMKWSPAQREAFLGVDAGRRVNRFLKGERRTDVARYVSGQVLEARLVVEGGLHEPSEAKRALEQLIPPLLEALRGRRAAYVTVHAETIGGRLSATRPVKDALDLRSLRTLALLALEDSAALPLGVDTLSVQLSGLIRPGRMVGLWAGAEERGVTRRVLERYPRALVRVRWLDPWSYARHAQFEWVDYQTGEVRPTAMTPRAQRAVLSPARAREQAVERALAFFEGRAP